MSAVEFHTHRPHARTSMLVAGAAALFFGLLGLTYPEPSGRAASLGLAAISLVGSMFGLAASLDKKVRLSIGSDGLMYRSFSARTVPWSAISTFLLIRTYSRWIRWGQVELVHQKSLDMINFDVADLSAYPGGPFRGLSRAVQRLARRPPIAIQLWFIDATPDAVVAALRAHWPGEIKTIDVKPK